MSVNCSSMPFRFTMMVAARTACHGGASLGLPRGTQMLTTLTLPA